MTIHKTMDELAQGMREAAAQAAESDESVRRHLGMCAASNIRTVMSQSPLSRVVEAAIAYFREHFKMVEVQSVFGALYPTPEWKVVAGAGPPQHILIPKPKPLKLVAERDQEELSNTQARKLRRRIRTLERALGQIAYQELPRKRERDRIHANIEIAHAALEEGSL